MNTKPFLKLAASLISLSLPMISASAVEAKIIKKYDFENKSFNGLSLQYQNKVCNSSKSYIQGKLFNIVSEPTRKGRYALRHNIKNCDKRSELVIPRSFFQKDQEYWIGWSYYIPKNFNKPGKNSYTIIQQMLYKNAAEDQHNGRTLFECNKRVNKLKNGKPGVRTVGAPASDMTISSSGDKFNYKLKYYKGKDSQGRSIFGCKSFPIPAETDKWQDFVMHVKFSDTSSKGFVRLWKNGKLYIDEKAGLMKPGVETMGAWKIGAYVGSPGSGERLLYTDEVKVGDRSSSFQEVSPEGSAPKGNSTSKSEENSSNTNSSQPISSGEKNLALTSSISVSAQQKENPGKNAVDGKTDNRWAAQGYPQTLTIRLPESETIDRLEIVPLKGRAYQFKAVTGDGRLIVDRTDNTKGGEVISASFKPIKTKYVKLTVTGCQGSSCSSQKWVSLKEVRVFKAQ